MREVPTYSPRPGSYSVLYALALLFGRLPDKRAAWVLTAAEYRAFIEPHKVLFAPRCLTPYIPRIDPTREPTMKRITIAYCRDRFIDA